MIRIIGELKVVHSQEFLVFLTTRKNETKISSVNGASGGGAEGSTEQRPAPAEAGRDLNKMDAGLKNPKEGAVALEARGGVSWANSALQRPMNPLLEPSAEALRALDAYFDKVFAGLGPRHAAARYLRRRLATELHLHVEQRSHVEEVSKQTACARAVMAALRMHSRFLDNVGGSRRHCIVSKYHGLLYAVAKLCFDCRLQDSQVVCALLEAIFWCEGSLDNLMVGALLGIVSTHVFNAWKSDFESRQENLEALDYFLEQASRGLLRFDPNAVTDDEEELKPGLLSAGGWGNAGSVALVAAEGVAEGEVPPVRVPVVWWRGGAGPLPLAELPLRSYGRLRPLALALLLANADAVRLLLRHGARPLDASPLYAWCGRRVARDDLAQEGCVRVLLRAVLWVDVVELEMMDSPGSWARQEGLEGLEGLPADALVVARGSPEDALVPPQRRRRGEGAEPPTLKHLARCAVRRVMRRARTLPFGLAALPLPSALHDYLDLLTD